MPEVESGTLSLTAVLTPEHSANPYPLYQQLRERQPVYWDEPAGSWVLTRYADVMAALRDARLSAERVTLDPGWFPEQVRPVLEPPIRALARQMIFLDPPDHTRLRGLVAKAFTPRMVEAMRPRIQNIVDTLIDAVWERGQMDVIADLAYPLPSRITMEMLGVPPQDHARFAQWTADYGALLDGKVRTRKGVARVLCGIADLMAYFRQIVAERRAVRQDDLMQALMDAEQQGDRLSEEELLANCVLLLAAGHGTLTHLIGNGLLALFQHPEQLRALPRDAAGLAAAVDELLRFDGPVQAVARLAKEDVSIGGQTIRAGQGVLICLGAANRDPARFPEPDTLDLARFDNRHVAFGHGIHFCLGGPLAHVGAEIALGTLTGRFSQLRLASSALEWDVGLAFRGLTALPVLLA